MTAGRQEDINVKNRSRPEHKNTYLLEDTKTEREKKKKTWTKDEK